MRRRTAFEGFARGATTRRREARESLSAGTRIFFLKAPDLDVRLRLTVRHPCLCQRWILTASERPAAWLGRRPRTATRPPAATDCFPTQTLTRPCVRAPSVSLRMTT